MINSPNTSSNITEDSRRLRWKSRIEIGNLVHVNSSIYNSPSFSPAIQIIDIIDSDLGFSDILYRLESYQNPKGWAYFDLYYYHELALDVATQIIL